MRVRATILTAMVVLSMVTAGASGALAASDAGGRANGEDTVLRPDETVNNTTDGRYRGVEPTRNYTDKPVHLGTAPDDFSTAGTSDGASAAAGGSSSIVMDPSDDDHPAVGTTRYFLALDTDGYYFKAFTLLSVGDNVEVWVARDLSWPAGDPRVDPTISESQAEALTAQFDSNIYPTESRVFGKPAPRNGTQSLLEQFGLVPEDYYQVTDGSKTAVLVDNVRDRNYYDPSYPLYIAGFYSPTIQQYTDRNAITIDAYAWDAVNETDRTTGYEGTLAHEYQHLIHNDLDADETTWVNEGMADYAEYVTGYGVPQGHVSAYEQLPSNSLTNWEDQGAINVLADYGAAFAWTMYLDDRYGTDFISNLAHDTQNGIPSVESTLDETGANADFYGLYQDFSTAVVTDDVRLPPKDKYHIDGLQLEVNTSGNVGTAGAWGTNYRTIDTGSKGPITDVTVSGTDFTDTEWSTATDPVDGHGQVLYSGSGNLLDRSAIVEVDLSGVENPELAFESFQRIETNWDYGFVQVSTDGGETWTSLANQHTDATPAAGAHPTVTANLPGLTGDTDGWQTQTFDLSAYAGNESVLVRFRYVTDWAVVSPGWWIQNVTVAGEQVPTDTVDPYMSLREATGNHVEYQFTFIGVKHNGNYQVKQLDTRTFTDSEETALKQFLHNGNFERVIVASTWAAKPGEGGRVPVGVEFEFQEAGDDNPRNDN